MWKKANMSEIYGNKDFRLLNIKSGQVLKLNCSDSDNTNFYLIGQVLEVLLNEKYLSKKNLNENEFVAMCKNINNDRKTVNSLLK